MGPSSCHSLPAGILNRLRPPNRAKFADPGRQHSMSGQRSQAFLPSHMWSTRRPAHPWITASPDDPQSLQVSGLCGRGTAGVRGVERPDCRYSATSHRRAAPAKAFPPFERPVADIISPHRSTEAKRDANAGGSSSSRALMRLKPGMVVGDIGAGSGFYHRQGCPARVSGRPAPSSLRMCGAIT